ncbi:unnamed protein product [Brachionus calyciflorus]|uniref:SWIM-type domain-containing protein n=1 Tax=Brachionus calyciflorus TaxID=104777 RepID=A0A814NEQ5_9BILA|nr:unnamed protein product [Brachionus calyciflorus]
MIQRKLLSGHKKRPLVKPFVITNSNAKIIDVYGNHAATDNGALIMENVMKTDNDLKDLLKKIEELQADGFPKLNVEIIRKNITFGYYQLEQANGYLFEHFSANEDYEFLVSNNLENEEDSKIVFAKIQSRHSNSFKYKKFVSFKPYSNNLDNLSWICSCKTGKKTLGCCSHVAALIYFMGYGRFNLENIPKAGMKLKNIIIPILNDTDDDEEVSSILPQDLMKRSLSIDSEINNNPTETKK